MKNYLQNVRDITGAVIVIAILAPLIAFVAVIAVVFYLFDGTATILRYE